MQKLDIFTLMVGPAAANCCIIKCNESAESIVVDPGGDGQRIIQVIKENSCSVKWIVHTHAHFDHCLATHEIDQHCRSVQEIEHKIALHPADLELYNQLEVQCRWFGINTNAAVPAISYELKDDEVISFGSTSFTVLHTPGHSPGSCCLYFTEHNILISGDTLFAMGIGRTDLPGGNSDALINSIKNRLFTLDDTTQVIPGHGGSTTIGNEKTMNPFF